MDRATIIKVFVSALLVLYLFKGILALMMNHVLIRMERKGKEQEVKNKAALEQWRKDRGW